MGIEYRDIIQKWKNNFDFRTIVSAAVSFLITAAFALYNGFLGVFYGTLWNGCICIYYILLAVTRAYIVFSERRINHIGADVYKDRKRILKITSFFLLFINVSLVVPVTLMVYNKKPVTLGLIPAIAMAAYTTYKIIFASINLKRKKKTDNVLVKELQSINFMDALISILTLQNTLIAVASDGTNADNMLALTATTSTVILGVITVMSISGVFKSINKT